MGGCRRPWRIGTNILIVQHPRKPWHQIREAQVAHEGGRVGEGHAHRRGLLGQGRLGVDLAWRRGPYKDSTGYLEKDFKVYYICLLDSWLSKTMQSIKKTRRERCWQFCRLTWPPGLLKFYNPGPGPHTTYVQHQKFPYLRLAKAQACKYP